MRIRRLDQCRERVCTYGTYTHARTRGAVRPITDRLRDFTRRARPRTSSMRSISSMSRDGRESCAAAAERRTARSACEPKCADNRFMAKNRPPPFAISPALMMCSADHQLAGFDCSQIQYNRTHTPKNHVRTKCICTHFQNDSTREDRTGETINHRIAHLKAPRLQLQSWAPTAR